MQRTNLARIVTPRWYHRAAPGYPVAAGAQGPSTRPEWHLRALCREMGTEEFFPSGGQTGERARALCAARPVRTECLEFALADPTISGVWGRTNARERRALRREVA